MHHAASRRPFPWLGLPTDRALIRMGVGAACLLVASASWGFNWPAIKVISLEIPPMFARGVAAMAAAALLFGLAALRRERLLPGAGQWRSLAWRSFTNVFAWMGFSALSVQWLRPPEGALLVYTMPLWAMLLSWALEGVRPTARALAALVMAAAGVAVILGGSGMAFSAARLPGVGFALAAAVLFGLGSVTARRPLALPALSATAWQLALGGLALAAVSLAFESQPAAPLSAQGLCAWAYMALGPMAAGYLAWFAAVRALPASVAATGMLMAPLWAAVGSFLAFGDRFSGIEAIGFAATLCGVALALSPGLRRPAAPVRAEPVSA
ncbi:DMT family transporter [Hansschlegelia sp.]|uniref:DMT family transporter n=1 Tax=Hansschlegelia sp. TaxID=2041892 RepID=UPI002C20F2B4|nr:DMT family transporter [Hansschlegelia sp.]HVI28838.1 DMT family transporter [Hansschlegelia sp.]